MGQRRYAFYRIALATRCHHRLRPFQMRLSHLGGTEEERERSNECLATWKKTPLIKTCLGHTRHTRARVGGDLFLAKKLTNMWLWRHRHEVTELQTSGGGRSSSVSRERRPRSPLPPLKGYLLGHVRGQNQWTHFYLGPTQRATRNISIIIISTINYDFLLSTFHIKRNLIKN